MAFTSLVVPVKIAAGGQSDETNGEAATPAPSNRVLGNRAAQRDGGDLHRQYQFR